MRIVLVGVLILCCCPLVLPPPGGMQPEAFRLIGVTVLMATLWVSQAIPLAATSLLPLVLFPVLGIQSAKTVSASYINDNVFLYLGGFILALGIERWNLHRRIALNVVQLVGVSPRRLVLGFLVATGVLSMWISNTAATLLMLPIALALLKTLDEEQNVPAESSRAAGPAGNGRDRISDHLAVPLLLAIAYSASIGGLTTIMGTPTNSQAVTIYETTYPDAPPISVAQWLLACAPLGAVYLLATWLVLTWRLPGGHEHDSSLKQELKKRLVALGRPTSAELRMLLMFFLTAALWVFRQQLSVGAVTILPGWSGFVPTWLNALGMSLSPEELPQFAESCVNDSTVAMLVAVLLFCIPSGTVDSQGNSVPLMDWPTATRLPWDIMLLFGGGFALAGAFKSTDLSAWLGTAIHGPLQSMPLWAVIAIVCCLMTFLTEFTSNVATVSTLLPTLCAVTDALSVDPRLLIVPATLATSCAFMLPIATPPNAIVFASGRVHVRQMVYYGVLLNLIGIPIFTVGTFLLIKPLLGIP
ncbi:MAG: SLC13 family permease [Planctomycetaceae bacterium]